MYCAHKVVSTVYNVSSTLCSLSEDEEQDSLEPWTSLIKQLAALIMALAALITAFQGCGF